MNVELLLHSAAFIISFVVHPKFFAFDVAILLTECPQYFEFMSFPDMLMHWVNHLDIVVDDLLLYCFIMDLNNGSSFSRGGKSYKTSKIFSQVVHGLPIFSLEFYLRMCWNVHLNQNVENFSPKASIFS